METMCWEIQVDSGGFLKGVIMAQCITLQFQGNGTRSSVEHPGSADLSRMKRSYRKCQAGDGDAKPIMAPMGRFLVGKRCSVEVNWKALA